MEETWALTFRGGAPGVAAAVLGLACNLAVTVWAIHSLVSRSRTWTLRWAAVSLLVGLVVSALAWIEARAGYAQVMAAADGVADATDLIMRGHYEIMRPVEMCLLLLVLPLGLGTWLLVRGSMLPDPQPGGAERTEPAGTSSRWALFATIGFSSIGIGLTLWAVADVNHFGAFIMALLVAL